MDIFQIAAIGIIGAVLAVMIKREAPIFAIMISLAVTVLIFLLLLPQLAAVISLINGIGIHLGSGREHILAVIKIIGIAYVAEFASQLCADCGENSIASKIDLAGKVLIMVIGAPIVIGLLETVIAMIP
ncbi:MAG: stage III sporulation protein AD [Defluviitaleaceae bacterium]|nr:stage III sporulation protein AD [Defluviitaleaceae bacterium]